MTSSYFSAVKSSDVQIRIYGRENKLNIRLYVLHLRLLWQHRSIKNIETIIIKESICVIPFDSKQFLAALFLLIVSSL